MKRVSMLLIAGASLALLLGGCPANTPPVDDMMQEEINRAQDFNDFAAALVRDERDENATPVSLDGRQFRFRSDPTAFDALLSSTPAEESF